MTWRVTPRGLRGAGTVGLAIVAAFALAIEVLVVRSETAMLARAYFVGPVAWPLLWLLAWRKGLAATAWGLMALYAGQGFVAGFSWGGLLLLALPVYAAANLLFRWAARHERRPKPNA